MNVSFDYDDTWTKDPESWLSVATLLKMRGHQCYLVTGRVGWSDDMERMGLPSWMPQIYCGREPKDRYCRKKGIVIDVWIDDIPECIRETKILGGDL